MATQVNAVLASLTTTQVLTTEIATELQNNNHSEPPEIWLNGSSTTKDLKKGKMEAQVDILCLLAQPKGQQ